MSQIRQADYVRIIGQQVSGISHVQEEACRLIACEAEYMLRLVIQESIKYSKQFNRSSLKVKDVSYALSDLNIYDKLYGHEEHEGLQYKKVTDFWYAKRTESELEQSIKKELLNLRIPPKISISLHWISINGIVPKTPENSFIKTKEDIKRQKEEDMVLEKKHENMKQILIKENMDGILSRELSQFLFHLIDVIRKEEELINNKKAYRESAEFKKVRECLQQNPGLNNIVPFLLNLIYDQHAVPVYNGYIKKKIYVKLIMALANNRSINLEYHSHAIVKVLMTFITSTNLSINVINKTLRKELNFRDYSAKSLIAFIYRYSDKYPNLQYEIADVLIHLLIKPKEESGNLSSFYGILRCFYYLNTNLIKDILLHQLPAFIQNYGIFKDYSSSIAKQGNSFSTTVALESTTIKIKEVGAENEIARHKLRFHMVNCIQNALADILSKILANIRFYNAYSTTETLNIYKFFTDCFGEMAILHILKSFKMNSIQSVADDYERCIRAVNVDYFI